MPTLTLVLWGLVTLLTLLLVARLFWSGQCPVYPFFTAYLVVNLLQTVVGVFLYQWYGFESMFSFQLAWTTQAVVVVARAFAAGEVCWLALRRYKGVWALAVRILLACGILVLGLTLYFGRMGYQYAVITLEVGLEAFIATWIVGLFLFARYYQVDVPRTLRLLGLGLGLHSCLKILNDLVFEKYAKTYVTHWNDVTSGSFVAILLIWLWALKAPVEVRAIAPSLRAAHIYRTLMPQVNQRLLELNERLSQLWHLESTKL